MNQRMARIYRTKDQIEFAESGINKDLTYHGLKHKHEKILFDAMSISRLNASWSDESQRRFDRYVLTSMIKANRNVVWSFSQPLDGDGWKLRQAFQHLIQEYLKADSTVGFARYYERRGCGWKHKLDNLQLRIRAQIARFRHWKRVCESEIQFLDWHSLRMCLDTAFLNCSANAQSTLAVRDEDLLECWLKETKQLVEHIYFNMKAVTTLHRDTQKAALRERFSEVPLLDVLGGYKLHDLFRRMSRDIRFSAIEYFSMLDESDGENMLHCNAASEEENGFKDALEALSHLINKWTWDSNLYANLRTVEAALRQDGLTFLRGPKIGRGRRKGHHAHITKTVYGIPAATEYDYIERLTHWREIDVAPYDPQAYQPHSGEDCNICLQEQSPIVDEKVTSPEWEKLACGHHFHSFCIKEWMTMANRQGTMSCPMCRKDYDGPDAKEPIMSDRSEYGDSSDDEDEDEDEYDEDDPNGWFPLGYSGTYDTEIDILGADSPIHTDPQSSDSNPYASPSPSPPSSENSPGSESEPDSL